ncbi:MAG: response regulator [Candidatus Eisenbacteria sp.]|nr:response regulator [Candidatus Eisenbacteria bacterium]
MTRILVVDDDDQVRAMLRMMLERAGYEVDEAPNGRVAIDRHRATPADLIVLDILMPEMEGVETMLTMRRQDPAVKIIAISGGGRVSPQTYLDSAQKLGARKTFTKPVDREELLQGIRELLAEPAQPTP